MNARRTPGRILARHLEDQLLELFRDRRSPDLLGFRFEPPVPPERTTMPVVTENSVRSENAEVPIIREILVVPR